MVQMWQGIDKYFSMLLLHSHDIALTASYWVFA